MGRDAFKDVQRDSLSTDPKTGVYIAEIVEVVDPEDWGRYKIRVPSIHGSIDDYSDDALPFAWNSAPGKGTFRSGMYINYVIGSTVIVAFEGGDPARPIIINGIDKKPTSDWVYTGSGDTSKEWSPTDQVSDLPLERRGKNEANIVYKSPKGAMLIIDETDGAEVLRLVDRSGQEFKMSSPVVAGPGGNELPRGDGRLSPGQVSSGTMEMVNLYNDKIRLFFDGSSRFILIEDGASGNRIRIDVLTGNWIVDVVNNEVRTIGGNETTTVTGNVVLNVTGNATVQVDGSVALNSDTSVTVTAPVINLN